MGTYVFGGGVFFSQQAPIGERGGGGTCLFGGLKIWVYKWEENEVLFFKCEEMKNG